MSELTAKAPREIRYRGILTTRGLRLFALFCMTLSQFSSVLVAANKAAVLLGEHLISDFALRVMTALIPLGQVTFPLLLIASFALVLSGEESFKRMLITYAILAVATYFAIVLLLANTADFIVSQLPELVPEFVKEIHLDKVPSALLRRLIAVVLPGDGTIHLESLNGLLEAAGITSFSLPDAQQITNFLQKLGMDGSMIDAALSFVGKLDVETVASAIEKYGAIILEAANADLAGMWDTFLLPRINSYIGSMMNLNVFLDLFLYTLFYFFIQYRPKRLRGGKILLFRCCAFFPGLYLMLSAMISSNIRTSFTTYPVWFTALLGRCNISMLAVFFLLVLFEKYREIEFHDKCELSGTNGAISHNERKRRWREYRNGKQSSLQFSVYASWVLIGVSIFDRLLSVVPLLSSWGIGKSYHMMLATPALILFSYNKKPKYKVFNAAIPIYYALHFLALIVLCLGILVYGVQLITGEQIF